ncbi:MAG TPA: NAD(P)/FAD-dependent oxidoreductase [Polyangiaceae bacterium]|nr:NAD(P)/FAD-dependent oxidoreductase [Polyangiaceae bacterium]
MTNGKRVVVIGGGLSGLAASYDLVRAGFHVTLLEAAADFGGLASSVRLEGHPIERFYHFICRADRHLLALVEELGLGSKLFWHQTRTSFYYNGASYAFGSPFDLLQFEPIPWLQRLRFGLHVLHSRYREQWKWLDQVPAKPWLIESVGERAYEVIWHPLLKVKFGDYHDKVSAAWVWHRIWRVAASRRSVLERETFGCLEHGTATVVDALVEWLRKQPNAVVRTEARVQPLDIQNGRVVAVKAGDEVFPCDAVVSTVALPALGRLVPGEKTAYFESARSVEYLGVVCMLLSLKRPFSGSFWTNINDPRVSFNGVIEQSALNQNLRDKGLNVLYVPFYLPTREERYARSDESLLDEYVPMLQVVNPAFDRSWIKEYHVFRTPYAQPVFSTHFVSRMPAHQTPIGGFYVTDSTQFYPEDRTISAAIEQGRKVAGMIQAAQR